MFDKNLQTKKFTTHPTNVYLPKSKDVLDTRGTRATSCHLYFEKIFIIYSEKILWRSQGHMLWWNRYMFHKGGAIVIHRTSREHLSVQMTLKQKPKIRQEFAFQGQQFPLIHGFTLHGFSHLWSTVVQKHYMKNSRNKQSKISYSILSSVAKCL